MDSVMNHKSSHVLDDQGKWGHAQPKGLQLHEEPGSPELAAETLKLKPRGNDNTHNHPIMGILCDFFFFPAKSLWENLTSGFLLRG